MTSTKQPEEGTRRDNTDTAKDSSDLTTAPPPVYSPRRSHDSLTDTTMTIIPKTGTGTQLQPGKPNPPMTTILPPVPHNIAQLKALKNKPKEITCPHCDTIQTTRVERHASEKTAQCIGACCLVLPLIGSLVPVCLRCHYTTTHYCTCPGCEKPILHIAVDTETGERSKRAIILPPWPGPGGGGGGGGDVVAAEEMEKDLILESETARPGKRRMLCEGLCGFWEMARICGEGVYVMSVGTVLGPGGAVREMKRLDVKERERDKGRRGRGNPGVGGEA